MSASDYEPLDLSPVCNAGREIARAGHIPATGTQVFRGLPFQIGSSESSTPETPCFVAFDKAATLPVSIEVGRAARHVVFAHALRESHLMEGSPVGREIARYVFVFEDGERLEAPIRERFEIAIVPFDYSWFPLLATPDEKTKLFPRDEGKWDQSGLRRSEIRVALPHDYYLWSWENPRPDAVISRLEIHPSGVLPFFVAAMTLGHVDEKPLRPPPALPVHIAVSDEAIAGAPFDLEVLVDRGDATYAHPLPAPGADEFLNDDLRGYGQELNTHNDPAYVQVAANPSATLTIKSGEETIGQANWGELSTHGALQAGRAHLEIIQSGKNWVHTTILDDATGKPIPCRVHFRDVRGIPYEPHGHHAHIMSDQYAHQIEPDAGGSLRLGHANYAYIDGRCQGWLPRGEVLVDVARGYEYEPLRARIQIAPGQRELVLRLKREHDLNAERYFSGDTHVHFLSSQGALTEAAGEDLDVINLLITQWGHMFAKTEEFTGKPQRSGDGETIVYTSQENRQHALGHLTLLGLKGPVMPFCTDGGAEAEIGGHLETTMSHWADACHAQGGTVIIPHLPNPNGEPAALIATGRADAVEMLLHHPFFHHEYYRYLNGGYRLPLVGGTDKMDAGVPVGLYRTYAYIPPDEEFNYDNWLKALRNGNTFLSGGPLLKFSVNGSPIGSTLQLKSGGGTVEIEARATSIFPIHTLQIVCNGSVVASTESTPGAKELHLREKLKIESASWLCARCAGPEYSSIKHRDSWKRGIMAHTSPIYIACGNEYSLFSPDTAHYMLTLLDGSLQYIRHHAAHHAPGQITHHHHHHDHMEFLEAPFQEAAAAIHRKMHEHGIPH
jgi:hypothetical protein